MARSDDKDKVIPFPGRVAESNAATAGSTDIAMEDASLWLVRLRGGFDETRRAEFKTWLHENPRNAQALQEIATFWGEEDIVAAELARQNMRFAPARVMRYAAAVVFAIGLGMLMYVNVPVTEPPPVAAVQYEQTFTTALGERSSHTLPDGSVITLNTSSEVRVIYHERDRIVDLRRGEAHFTVAHNVERPFGVRAAGHIVQAVGTAFNVRLQQAGAAEVTVTEGVVQILDAEDSPPADAALQPVDEWWTRPALSGGVTPGQLVLIGATSNALAEVRQLNPEALESKLAWQEGSLMFVDEPLRAVLAEFSRYSATEFVLDDADLAEVRIGGYFASGNIEGLLGTLRDNFQIEAERVSDTRIVLRSQN